MLYTKCNHKLEWYIREQKRKCNQKRNFILGKGWVGWKNVSRNSSDPLEIVFHFDSIREFNAMHIHASNQFSEGVQVRRIVHFKEKAFKHNILKEIS